MEDHGGKKAKVTFSPYTLDTLWLSYGLSEALFIYDLSRTCREKSKRGN